MFSYPRGANSDSKSVGRPMNELLCNTKEDLTKFEVDNIKKSEMPRARKMSQADEILEYSDDEGGPWFEYYRSKNHLTDSNRGVQ